MECQALVDAERTDWMLVMIPVGTLTKNGERIDAQRREDVAQEVARITGGMTRWGTRGCWVSPQGTLVPEAGEMWMIECGNQAELTAIEGLIREKLCQAEVISWALSQME